MSHTPILVFCLGSRPLFPLGGGNVAALQHEGRVGSMRPGRSLGRRKVLPSTSGQLPPVLEGLGRGRARGAARGTKWPAVLSALTPDARRPPGGGTGTPARTSRSGGGWGPWH